MKFFGLLRIILFVAIASNVFGIERSVEELKILLNKSGEDTTRLNVLNALVEEISDENVWPKYNEQLGALAFKLKKSSNPRIAYLAKKHYATYLNNLGFLWVNKGNSVIAISYFIESLNADKEIGNLHGQAYSENNLGIMYMNEGKIDTALNYFNRSLDKYKTIKDKKGQALSLNNIGYIFNNQGNVPKALECFHESLRLREALGDKNEIGFNYINIGSIYLDQKDYSKAIESFKSALKIFEELSSKQGQASALNNIATCYKEQEKYDNAKRLFQRAANLFEEIGDKRGFAASIGNVGICSKVLGNTNTATACLKRGLNIYLEINDKDGLAHTYNSLAQVYLSLNNLKEAKESALESYKISKELNFPDEISHSAKTLSEIYKKEGNCDKSFEMFELYIALRDTTRNSSNEKLVVKQQAKYEYETKMALAAAEQEKVDAIAQAETKRQKIILIFTVVGLILVVVFSIFLYRRFKITQRQKTIIELQKAEVEKQREISDQQKHVIEEINREIVDSINYAKRLQDATLPPLDFIKEYIPQLLIFFKPKDIVAGDFYWFEKKEDYVYIAAADCTGHGVPGAMVSVVCSNALYRSVNEFGLKETGEILDKTRNLVVETFEKSGDSVKDGMDISLIRLPIKQSGTKNHVQWSGANNPLWLIDNSKVFSVVKADKQPIGKCDNPLPFKTHDFILEKNSMLYIFTDGYADQFGGPNGKKFMYKQLQNVLMAVHHQELDSQRQMLDGVLADWMLETSQVDDICVIGIRV